MPELGDAYLVHRRPDLPLNVSNCLHEVRMRFFGANFSDCSQVAPQCSSTEIGDPQVINLKALVGASGFEPGASCAQGKL